MSKLAMMMLVVMVAAVAADVPAFPQSFTTDEKDTILIYQGDYKISDDTICCPLNSPGCKVQVESDEGMNYVDATHNRTYFQPLGSNQAVVTLFDAGKQYLIQDNTCQYYCPLQGDEFGTFGPDPSAKDLGQKTCPGTSQMCTDYEWKEMLFKIITMQISDFFVDAAGLPFGEVDQLTPFGEPLGTSTSLWQNFKAGVPASSLWDDIKGMADCPESQNCNSDSTMMRGFLRNKAMKSWAFYANVLPPKEKK